MPALPFNREFAAVLSFILLMAVANIGLGYATAVLAARVGAPFPRLRVARWPKAAPVAAPPECVAEGTEAVPPATEEAAPPTADQHTADPAISVVATAVQPPAAAAQAESCPCGDDLPDAWLAVLEEVRRLRPFADAVSDVLRLPLGRYRRGLLEVDDALRACQQAGSPAALEECCEVLRQENTAWLQEQAAATLRLQQRSGSLGDVELLATRLEEVLLGQRAQIESTAASLSRIDRSQPAHVHDLLDEVIGLLDTCHALRDKMHEAMLTILASEDRLEQIEQPLLVDALTGLLNRTGMEMLVQRWWREDAQRRRPLSMALLDVDRQGSINRLQGTRAGDGLLSAVGQLVDQTMRSRRGFDLAARLAVQQVLLFLGDTAPRNATCAAERFRQAVARCTFRRHGQPVDVSLTAAVVGVEPQDDMQCVVRRLRRTLRLAKEAGRNCTWLEENGQPVPVRAMDYDLPVQTLDIAPEVGHSNG